MILCVILGKYELDEMLVECEKFNFDIQKVFDIQIDLWGIKIVNVEIKYVDLNELMICVIVCQVEVECECCVKVIYVEGELQVLEKLFEVVWMLVQQFEVIQLCYLQMFMQIVGDKSLMIVFLLLMEVLGVVKKVVGG